LDLYGFVGLGLGWILGSLWICWVGFGLSQPNEWCNEKKKIRGHEWLPSLLSTTVALVLEV
jgi:hypothetical protein